MSERRLPITMTVGEFEEMSRLSHSSIYKLIREGHLHSAKILGRRMIVVDSYLALLRNDGRGGGKTRNANLKVLAENDDSAK